MSSEIFNEEAIQFLIGRLVNQQRSGGTMSLPARLLGPTRIPVPMGFRVIAATDGNGGTAFTLGWDDLENTRDITGYRVYVTRLVDAFDGAPTLVAAAKKSPAQAHVRGNAAETIVFFLQTEMTNGMVLPLELCPTTTATLGAPTGGGTAVIDTQSYLLTVASTPIVSPTASPADGRMWALWIQQDAIGGRNVTFDAAVQYPDVNINPDPNQWTKDFYVARAGKYWLFSREGTV